MTPDAKGAITMAMVADFLAFLSFVVDTSGRPLEQPEHVVLWARLMQEEPRLILRAPRGHGKTTLLLAYILWQCWRHNRTPSRWLVAPDSPTYEIVLFSATAMQVHELMTRFRDLLLANEPLFGGLMPHRPATGDRRTRWSSAQIRLRNGASLTVRAYGTSVRGMHPQLLVCDDVLNDDNSMTAEQRDKSLRYFMTTLLPMRTQQVVLIGTAIHQADLLARLGRGSPEGADRQRSGIGFLAMTFRALDEAREQSLWPGRFPVDELLRLRDADPLMFSREYQNDPRDNASSMFPYEVVQRAIDAGADLVLGGPQFHDAAERFVVGVDVARSGAASADYTVVMVVAWNLLIGTRRLVELRRHKGLEMPAQVELVCDLYIRYGVLAGMVENNGLQQWLVDALAARRETGGRIFGHRTGSNKADAREGIPRLALAFAANSWIIPSGDAESLRIARIFQAELAAFGYRPDGKLSGVGEHDDTVVAAWLVERAIAYVEEIMRQGPEYEIVTMDDLGIERVRIGDWDDSY